MRERPILFSAPMVRALLAGTKTQTRRAVKPQPVESWTRSGNGPRSICSWSWPLPDGQHVPVPGGMLVRCPYGQRGDRLWVREAWSTLPMYDGMKPSDMAPHFAGTIRFKADGHQSGKLRPGMFMPRWASRITLEVTGVRVERLWQISLADVQAEGCPHEPKTEAAASWYRELWEQINGPGSWDANPWVWVVEFKRVHP